MLVLSDVHLGSDLNDHAGATRRSRRVDEDLVRLLEHYRATPPQGERWRIVIAGDFIDFIGITLLPRGEQALETAPSAEEMEHGLGNTEDHARVKLARVAARHDDVFGALARFVADGHALTIVHGNHDVEFHWDAVKADFRELLLARVYPGAADRAPPDVSGELPTRAADAAQFLARIEFQPWFFYAQGLAYIEHGHQYDPFCASEHVMAPVAPDDPRRIARGFCDVLLRYVVRPRGLHEHGHQKMGLVSYVRLGMNLGFGGLTRLATSFGRAVLALLRLRRTWTPERAGRMRAEHEKRIALLSEKTRIGLDRLRALLALQVPPVTRTIMGILKSVLLDRLAIALGALALIVTLLAVFGATSAVTLTGIATVGATWALVSRYLTKTRKVDYDEELVERAGRLARILPAAFVVMGHTHTPVQLPVADGASTYINVGSWAEEEAKEGELGESPRAARTHLVIHRADAGPVAEFLAWDGDAPRKFGESRPAVPGGPQKDPPRSGGRLAA